MNSLRRRIFRWICANPLVSLALFAFMAACGGGGAGAQNPAPPPVPSVSLSFVGGPVSVLQAQTVSLPVTIQRGGGFTGAVRISADGLPQGVSLGVAPGGDITGDSATVSFIAAPTAGVGSVQAMLRVVAVGGSPSSGSSLAIQVLPPPAGFQITLGTSILTLPRPLPGDTGPRLSRPIPVTLSRVGGYAGAPTWTVEGMPAGVTATFSPSSTGEPTGFVLSADATASAGTSALTVRASGGTLAATAVLTLTLSGGNDFQLKPNVVELLESAVTVLSVTAEAVTLQGSVSSIQAGQVLIHNAPDDKRFLRTVVSVSSQGGNTVIATSPATVEEVFESAAISKSETVPASALAGMQPANAAVTIGAPIPGLVAPLGDAQLVLPIAISKWELTDGNGLVLAEISGSITLTLGVETRLEKDWLSVREFRVAPYLVVSGDLDITGRVSADFNYTGPITLPFKFPTPIGVGPLGVNGEISVLLQVDGHLDGQGRLKVHGSVNGKGGIQYVNGAWSGVQEFSSGLAVTTAEVRGAASFGISLLKPQVGLNVLGIGEVHANSDLIRGEIEIVYQTSPQPGFLISTYGDFNVGIGGSLKLGGLNLWSSDITMDLPNFPIGDPVFLPDLLPTDTRIAYVTPDLKELRMMNGDGSNNTLIHADTNQLYSPCLGPDGDVIAFGRINLSGKGELCTVFTNGAGLSVKTGSNYSINHPAWGPTNIIAFDASDANNVKQLHTLRLSDGSITQITYDPGHSRHPSWSPDGTFLVYEYLDPASGRSRITRVDPSFLDSTRYLTTGDAPDYFDPSYSPNGRRIVFRDSAYIHVADDEGNIVSTIGMGGSYFFKHPVFSPDGNTLAVDNNPITAPTILVMGLDGAPSGPLAFGTYPSWRQIR